MVTIAQDRKAACIASHSCSAINVTSKKADPIKQVGRITVGAGNKEHFVLRLWPTLLFGTARPLCAPAFGYDQYGHVWDNDRGGNVGKQNNYQGRLSWFMMLGENTTADFSADLQKQYRKDGAVMTLADYENGDRSYNIADPLGESITSGGVRLKINHDT